MEEHVKIILYTYPFLQTVGKDYEEHIKNKALLSYKSTLSTQSLAEYIAGEIIKQRKLVWLKEKVDEVLGKLSEAERLLLEIRYFGKREKAKTAKQKFAEENKEHISERKYFRAQKRLARKVNALFVFAGITVELFEKTYSTMEIFQRAIAYLQRKMDRGKNQSSNS